MYSPHLLDLMLKEPSGQYRHQLNSDHYDDAMLPVVVVFHHVSDDV